MEFKLMNKGKRIETLSVIGLALMVFHFIYNADADEKINNVFLYASIGFVFVGLFVKSLANIIVVLWLKLSEAIGFVMSRILLGAVFYLCLYPFSLLYRLMNNDPLNIKEGKDSYFIKRDHTYKKKDLENIW
jgi:hypothetical protein